MSRRLVVLLIVLGAAVALAVASFVSVAIRLETSRVTSTSAPLAALAVFDRAQQRGDASAARVIGVTGRTAKSVRVVGSVDRFVFAVWRDGSHGVCIAAYPVTPGVPQAIANCVTLQSFGRGGITLSWTDPAGGETHTYVWTRDGNLF